MSKKQWEIVFYVALVVGVLVGLITLFPFSAGDPDTARENPLTYVWFGISLACFGMTVFAHYKHAPFIQDQDGGSGVIYVFWLLLVLGGASAVSGFVMQVLR